MIKEKEYKDAVVMRQSGCSLNEISKKLNISKSTASVWLKDVELDANAKNKLRLKTKKNSLVGLLKYNSGLSLQKQQNIIHDELAGKNKIGRLSERDIYCVGLGLYWGEGYKKGNQEFGFTNSDPSMIRFYIKWLEVVFGVEKKELILRVSINELHKKRNKSIESYWSKITEVPLLQFTKTSFIKTVSKKVYTNQNSHMGTLRIKLRKGTRLRREVIGAIKSIAF